ncbi:hypothetical protein QI633_19460 [Nocardioides sp. QY071]|uniref:hypothetical protein n=1 Tax=Nocardioides sp. QY071 TaxID=3044187 RepID=UPI00249A900A|nr:hypothetical protein [Nocardioides sp. QY071]WGY00707.1 hypothetical protein QI633_19460 [Nocardioides sp. QY071]
MSPRGRRLLRCLLAAPVLTLLFAAAPARADADDDPAAEQALAERFAPVLMLVRQDHACGPGEPYSPSAVEVLFDNPTVALRGPWTSRDLVKVGPSAEDVSAGLPGYELDLPGNPLTPDCDYERWAERQWRGTKPTIYAHVATQKGIGDRIALQYFFFYAFNDYNNKHETDWERIQLEFAAPDAASALAEDLDPDLVVYSQHYGSEKARWGEEKLEVDDATHPVVYVSAGSHANQFSAGVFMGNTANTGFGCDTTAGEHDAVRAEVRSIPSDPALARSAYPWISYEGHYGEVGPKRFYAGPTGPNRKQSWAKPFSWSAKARDSSIEVPGGGATSSAVAETYCDLVGKGSDLFRGYVDDPWRGLVVLVAALLAVGWLVRRTSWATTALPLRIRRSAGQVVAASLDVLRERPGLFALAMAPPALFNVLAAVLQGVTVSSPVPGWVGALAVLIGTASLPVSAGALAAVVQVLDEEGLGARVNLRAAYRTSLRRLGAGLPALLVTALLVVGLTTSIVLAPLALVVLTAGVLLVPVVVLERRRGFAGLPRSVRLIRHSFATLVPVLALGLLLLTTIGAVVAALLFVVVPVPFVVLNTVPSVVLGVVWPFVALMCVYAYAAAVARAQDSQERAAVTSAATPDSSVGPASGA